MPRTYTIPEVRNNKIRVRRRDLVWDKVSWKQSTLWCNPGEMRTNYKIRFDGPHRILDYRIYASRVSTAEYFVVCGERIHVEIKK